MIIAAIILKVDGIAFTDLMDAVLALGDAMQTQYEDGSAMVPYEAYMHLATDGGAVSAVQITAKLDPERIM